jgi:hypothetical protein
MNINGANKFSLNSERRTPTTTGPITTPNCHPASKRANPADLVVGDVKSAILPPAAGLTALPKSPFISLVKTNHGKTKANGNNKF